MSESDTNSDTPMIELFGQHSWHAAGALRLNARGAKILLETLQAFLEKGPQVAEVFSSDGEGYDLHLVEGDWDQRLNLNHYIDAPGLEADCGDNLVFVQSKAGK